MYSTLHIMCIFLHSCFELHVCKLYNCNKAANSKEVESHVCYETSFPNTESTTRDVHVYTCTCTVKYRQSTPPLPPPQY